MVEKKVKMVEQEAVENTARNPTLTCRAVMGKLANTLQTDGSIIIHVEDEHPAGNTLIIYKKEKKLHKS